MFDLQFESSCKEEKQVGDLVFLGDNSGPAYEVIYIYCHQAWVKGIGHNQSQHIVSVSRLRLHLRREVRLAA